MAKKRKWTKFRHKVITGLVRIFLHPYSVLKYNIKVTPFKEQGKRAYLVLFNHQTAFDQFFVGMAFKGPVYYVASEDLFSMGWVSSLIRYIVAPIPIKKQTTDVSAVLNCMRVAKEGGTIAIAPEGNRTFSGKTEYMNSAIASLVKKLKLPVALYRIEGGYGVHPRWSDVVRKGKMRGYVSRVIEPEEYLSLSNEELFDIIKDELYINEAVADGEFCHNKRAEYLERAMYVCPYCGLSEFESSGENIRCKKCDLKISYSSDKRLISNDDKFPFEFVNDWYDFQSEYIKNADLSQYTDTPIYRECAAVKEVVLYKNKKKLIENAEISLYSDKIIVDEGKPTQLVMGFDEIDAVTVLGKNKLNIYFGKKVYQLESHKRFNALKYVHIYFKAKNVVIDGTNEQFLGI